MHLNLAGNVALVAASSEGLGKASARVLAQAGANVVINGKNEEKLNSAVDELEGVGSGEPEPFRSFRSSTVIIFPVLRFPDKRHTRQTTSRQRR